MRAQLSPGAVTTRGSDAIPFQRVYGAPFRATEHSLILTDIQRRILGSTPKTYRTPALATRFWDPLLISHTRTVAAPTDTRRRTDP